MTSIQELEETLLTIQSWRPSEEEREEAQTWINWLYTTIAGSTLSPQLRSRCIRQLRALCAHAECLPASFSLPEEIAYDRSPVSSSAYSDVYRGEWDGRVVALKVLRLHVDTRAKVTKGFHHEAIVWKCLRHPNVAPFLGVCAVFPACLVSEWMAFGTIAAYLEAHPQANKRALVSQIVDGLQYLHSLDIVHGDLKAANILINAQHMACLSDFGLTTVLYNTGTLTATGATRGTLRWMSPELLGNVVDSEDSGRPTEASDIYAVAMVFWEIYSGQIPFQDIGHEVVALLNISQGLRPKRPTGDRARDLSDRAWLWITQAWLADPRQRPRLEQLERYHGELVSSGPSSEAHISVSATLHQSGKDVPGRPLSDWQISPSFVPPPPGPAPSGRSALSPAKRTRSDSANTAERACSVQDPHVSFDGMSINNSVDLLTTHTIRNPLFIFSKLSIRSTVIYALDSSDPLYVLDIKPQSVSVRRGDAVVASINYPPAKRRFWNPNHPAVHFANWEEMVEICNWMWDTQEGKEMLIEGDLYTWVEQRTSSGNATYLLVKGNTIVGIFIHGAPEALLHKLPKSTLAAYAHIEFFGPELPHERVTDSIVVSLLVIPGML